MKFLVVALLLCRTGQCAAMDGKAAAYAEQLRNVALDAEACFRVRDLAFQKDDLRFYLNEGYLIFTKPVEGRRVAAVFSADIPGGDAEVIVFPPHRSERLSLSSFAKTPNLDEHFGAAVFIFSDGTGEQLLEQISSGEPRKAPEAGLLLATTHTPIVRNLATSYEIRLVQDHFGGVPDNGFFYAAVSGTQLGNFDLIFDPRRRDQILIGQVVYRGERRFFDIWTSFVGRSFRSGKRQPSSSPIALSNIRIDATLKPDLQLAATTRMTLTAAADVVQVVMFDLSQRMRITAARVNDEPAEVFARESLRANLIRGTDNGTFLLVLPRPMKRGETRQVAFDHEGDVVIPAGQGVYAVGARTNWYPNRDSAFANYELTFRYPRNVDLVATGELVEETTQGEWRIARRTTSSPIRFAGFNIGDYQKIAFNRAGVAIEVCANRKVEPALQPRTSPVTVAPGPPFRRPGSRPPDFLPMPSAALVLPNPASRLQWLATEIGAALEFMTQHFGPPPLKTLAISPIPGAFGQGFPGLVYLSTLSYLLPSERPAGLDSEYQRLFFSELLQSHEVAHQWWGNLVASASYQDDWIMEALANYSSLMFLEKRKGRKALDSVLSEYRERLLRKDSNGKTVESAGPIIWGARLHSSQTSESWRTITYEKGSWIMHMLRARMGDAAFLKMLGELARRYRFKQMGTEQFRQVAMEFLPRGADDPKLEAFFEQWVYGTGVPELKLSYTIQGKAPKARVRGTITQRDVSEDFSALVPVEVRLPGNRLVTKWVRTSSEPVGFTMELDRVPLKVQLDPGNGVLATHN